MNNRRKTFLATSFFIIIVSLMIFSGMKASIASLELHKIETEISQIEAVNRSLEDEIIMQTSLTLVSKESEDFVLPEHVVYLNKTVPFLGYAK